MSYYLFGFVLVFLAFSAGLIFLEVTAKDRRRPFSSRQKLLREPGHSLRQKITDLDRQLTRTFLSFSATGLVLLMLLANHGASYDPDPMSVVLDRLILGLLVVVVIAVSLAVVSSFRRRRNLALGLFGERIVAEHLEPLKASGHRVFHDVPAEVPLTRFAKRPGNIDHVVVGPAGVFAIETKTRRQGRTRVGVMAHEIIYDGRALAFPWGEDRHGLEQAGRQAEWLAAFLENQLGRPVAVQPLLVFPGWTILRKDRGPVEVLSPDELPAFIGSPPASGHTGFAVPAPDPASLGLVVRELEARCRDVGF